MNVAVCLALGLALPIALLAQSRDLVAPAEGNRREVRMEEFTRLTMSANNSGVTLSGIESNGNRANLELSQQETQQLVPAEQGKHQAILAGATNPPTATTPPPAEIRPEPRVRGDTSPPLLVATNPPPVNAPAPMPSVRSLTWFIVLALLALAGLFLFSRKPPAAGN